MKRRTLLPAALALPATALALPQWMSYPRGSACDVLVIGAGAAGLAAAVEAASAGASVTVLEQMPEIGGNTLISGGFYAAVDPARQKRQGIRDSEGLFYRQTFEHGGKKGRPELVRHLVSHAAEGLEWLEKLGMRFKPEVIEIYGAHWPRCHTPTLPLGQGYIRTLSAAALARGVTILTRAKARELILENGRVRGAVAISEGARRTFRARKAVILASGSFAANNALVARYAPALKGLTTNNIAGADGEIMMEAHRLGAALTGMEYIQCLPGCPPGKTRRVRFHNDVALFILVNSRGERFFREDGPRDALRDAVLALPGRYAFSIIDSLGLKRSSILVQKEALLALEAGEAWKGNTVEELARAMGLPEKQLRATVEDYNRGIALGKDRFGKRVGAATPPLTHPPFWACYAGMTVHYTEGGLAIDEQARCLDQAGRPIPGLYAAGTVTGGVHGQNRLGANGLPDAIVFGRTAGMNAAREP